MKIFCNKEPKKLTKFNFLLKRKLIFNRNRFLSRINKLQISAKTVIKISKNKVLFKMPKLVKKKKLLVKIRQKFPFIKN